MASVSFTNIHSVSCRMEMLMRETNVVRLWLSIIYCELILSASNYNIAHEQYCSW